MVEAILARVEREQLEQRRIRAEQDKKIALTDPVDIAFKHAMDQDLSYGVGEGRTQMGAVRAWEEILKRNDISQQQRLFATWRIASLYAYNFDSERGEQPNFDKSKKLFKEALNLIPGLLSAETINAATQYASQPGTKIEKAERKAEAYRFLKTATQQMRNQSAERINKYGYALDKRFFSGIVRLPDPDVAEKTKWLNMRLGDGQETVERSITAFLQGCHDEVAALRLLSLLEEFADPEDLEKWRGIVSGLHPKWATHEAALEALEDLKKQTVASAKSTDRNLGPTGSVEPLSTVPTHLPASQQGSNLTQTILPASLIVLLIAVLAILFRKRLLPRNQH
jgi:hypothetical protein